MAVLNIILEGDPILRKKSKAVETITSRIITILDDMAETLIKAEGVGLAAPQVGILRRIFVINEIDPETGENKIIDFINPKIVATIGTQENIEGCLSLPGKCGVTRRPETVTVEAKDRNGKLFSYTGSDLYARCLCHEYDHLDGVLYIDHALRMIDPEELETDE